MTLYDRTRRKFTIELEEKVRDTTRDPYVVLYSQRTSESPIPSNHHPAEIFVDWCYVIIHEITSTYFTKPLRLLSQ